MTCPCAFRHTRTTSRHALARRAASRGKIWIAAALRLKPVVGFLSIRLRGSVQTGHARPSSDGGWSTGTPSTWRGQRCLWRAAETCRIACRSVTFVNPVVNTESDTTIGSPLQLGSRSTLLLCLASYYTQHSDITENRYRNPDQPSARRPGLR